MSMGSRVHTSRRMKRVNGSKEMGGVFVTELTVNRIIHDYFIYSLNEQRKIV